MDERTPPDLPTEDPTDRDPDRWRSPGAGRVPQDEPAIEPRVDAPGDDEAIPLDAPAIAGDAVGDDTIRDGTVRGVIGTSHGSHGQGQGG